MMCCILIEVHALGGAELMAQLYIQGGAHLILICHGHVSFPLSNREASDIEARCNSTRHCEIWPRDLC